jgi:hypothetical protein
MLDAHQSDALPPLLGAKSNRTSRNGGLSPVFGKWWSVPGFRFDHFANFDTLSFLLSHPMGRQVCRQEREKCLT